MYKNLIEILRDSFSSAVVLPPGARHAKGATGQAGAGDLVAAGAHSAHKLYYSQLRATIRQLQRQAPFAQLSPGTAVSFLIPNSLEFIAVFFAIVGQRAVANPLNPAYTLDEVLFYLRDVEPRVVLVLRGAPNVETVRRAANIAGVPVYEVALELVAKYGQLAPAAVRGPLAHLARPAVHELHPPSHVSPPPQSQQPQQQKPKQKQQKQPARQQEAGSVKPTQNRLSRLSRLSTANVVQSEAIVTTASLDPHPDPLLNATALPPQHQQHHAYSPDDVALFLHTSGTTGRPKGVPLTHRNILASIANIVETCRLQPSDVSYLVMPLFHVHGLVGVLLSTLYSGGTVIVPHKFSVDRFWTDFIDLGATWYSAVPTIHQMLLLKADETYPGQSGALRFIRSCSSSLAPATMLALEKQFGAPVIEAYAMTEAAHQMTSNFLPRGMRKSGSVGRGRGVHVRIIDDKGRQVPLKAVGEVCVSGPNVFSGYHNNPKATAESFHFDAKRIAWFRTGDLGYMDEHKFLVLVGRIKEQINRGGEKISPVEIDQVFLQHPAVAEVVTFGVPSNLYGQEIEAAIVPKSVKPASGHTTTAAVNAEELTKYAASKLAPFKVPRQIHIVQAIPKTVTGKVQRRIVAEHFVKKMAEDMESRPKL